MINVNRFAHIDALRGVAALLVIWLHVSEVFFNISPETLANGTSFYDIAKIFDFGRIGVVIFFAISGFVICRSLKGDKIEGSKKFFVKRFLRLYPAFWVSILLGLFSLWWLFDKPFTWNIVVGNLTMLPDLLGKPPIIGLYWTLETELVFYFSCWILFVSGNINNPLSLFFISSSLTFLFVMSNMFFMPHVLRSALKIMPYSLAIMFWGGLFRYWYENKKNYTVIFGRKIKIQWLLIILTTIILMPALASITKGYIIHKNSLITFGISYVAGIFLFIAGSLVFKIKNKFMVWIGVISYSIYLFHPVVFYSLFWFLKNKAPYSLMTFHLSVYIAITVIISIILSAVVYNFIEKPAINLAQKLTTENVPS